jgi:hypothetical protein
MKPTTFTITFDAQGRPPHSIVEAMARAMAGMSWIDHLVDRSWDEIEQKEREYWLRFAGAGICGMAIEANRQSKNPLTTE